MYSVRNYKAVLLLVAIIAVSTFAVAAQQQVWSENSQNRSSIATDKAVARQSFPTEFKLYNLNIEPLREQLFSIVGGNARQQSVVISLPNADGKIESFEVFEASNFEPALQAQFPEIRAYSGRGITDRYATLKLSISPQGIQTAVFRTGQDNEFIEPYSQDRNVYAVFKSSKEKGDSPWSCATEESLFSVWNSKLELPMGDSPSSNAGQIKTMRLAQSCNGEYSNYFGATSAAQVNLVLAAFNNTLTRANGVYEKDLAIHLNLIPETVNVIYYDPATDPYTSLGSWNGQLQATLTANIGEANYDIGHMFGASGGGGNAGCIGCVCVNGSKGSGITSPADGIPQGDNFDIDYVVHEVGHQMGANHSFSHALESGTGQNKEVGSGITIMGYAGITSRDVAPHSIDTFHETSIQQIQVNMASKTCPVTTNMTANSTPVVASVPNYTIPITTPFALTSSATDADNDPLTYQWEQNDNATTSGANSVASPTKLTGPNWLSFRPTTSPTRTFPQLSTILAGQAVTGPLPGGDAGTNIEALSSVSRTLNFRLTVRDNRPYVAGSTIGQTQFTDTTVTVTNTAGPFKVNGLDAATTWAGNSTQTVTWDVANTTIAPISTANVKISLSIDGGQSFPTTLLASTPNDGSENITVPNVGTTQARIKIEAVGNIYFDINNANLTITTAPTANRTQYDFDADGKADISLYRPSSGTWFVQQSQAGFAATTFGASSDKIVPADYDGDGKTDVAVYRPSTGTWYLQRSQLGFSAYTFGAADDIPMPADYDGDGKADIAVFRPSSGTWFIQGSTAGFSAQTFGASGDKPVAGNYDNDAKADIAVFRPSSGTWFIQGSAAGFSAITFGASTDIPVPANYDGDTRTDVAVYRPSTGTWYIQGSTAGFSALTFGASTDLPAAADYDGDGKADIAVFRPSTGTWFLQRSSQGFAAVTFGASGDRPAPNAFVIP